MTFCFDILPGLESCMLLYTSHNLYHDTTREGLFATVLDLLITPDYFSHIQ